MGFWLTEGFIRMLLGWTILVKASEKENRKEALQTHKSTKVMEFLLDIFRQLSLDVIWSNLRPAGGKGIN